MATTLRTASDADIRTILGWTHALWGGGQDLLAYQTYTRGLMGTEWGQARYRFILGVDDYGEAVCACKSYEFDIWRGGKAGLAIGFGAVFTKTEARGKGHAAVMLQALMAEARNEGVAIALLYSDIGCEYYEKLGFQALGGLEAAAPALHGASAFRTFEPQDLALLARWWDALSHHPEFAPFRYARDEHYWGYLVERVGTSTWIYAPGGGPARGFLACRARPGVLSVLEAGWDLGVDETIFWRAVRVHATAIAGPDAQACGWLPQSAEQAGFTLTPVVDGIPMLAVLDGSKGPRDVALWGHDHF